MARTEHEHLTRKEIKGPDTFQVALTRAASWAGGHQKQIAVAVAGAVVLLAAGVGIFSFLQGREEKAGGLLYQALDAMEGEISSVPLPGVGRPVFKSAEEQQRAVVAAAEEVRKEYPSSRAARTAALAAGDAQLRLGAYDAARQQYEAFLRGAPGDDSLRFAALDGIALAWEGQGDLGRAADAWQRLADEVSFMKDRATIERARVLGKAGKVDEARKLLAAFPDEFKLSPLKPEAEARLAGLGGK